MELISEGQAGEVARLESRLIEFYNTFAHYPAFAEPSNYPALWEVVMERARLLRQQGASCRILEIGAGRSGFGEWLRRSDGRDGIHLTSQDITAANVEYLRLTSDAVVTRNIDQLEGSWNIIFHSYAYEHLCRPREFNETLWRHLAPGGSLVIQSPRYDFPWYFPPCLDHLTAGEKFWLALRLAGGDLVAMIASKPRFTIFADPAIFHRPFHRDRDAVHRVRKSDLRRLFGRRARFTEFSLAAGSWKDWIVKRFLTLRIVLQKTA